MTVVGTETFARRYPLFVLQRETFLAVLRGIAGLLFNKTLTIMNAK